MRYFCVLMKAYLSFRTHIRGLYASVVEKKLSTFKVRTALQSGTKHWRTTRPSNAIASLVELVESSLKSYKQFFPAFPKGSVRYLMGQMW